MKSLTNLHRYTLCALLALGLLFLGGCSRTAGEAVSAPPSASGYHAVFLQSGLVLIGKASELGNPWIKLDDVYYVRSQVNPETKEVSNQLVKRGNEWHAPDSMTINSRSIIMIEPVAEKSRVTELIKGMKGFETKK